jgi:Cdc6-like AAA superfamily ATPase
VSTNGSFCGNVITDACSPLYSNNKALNHSQKLAVHAALRPLIVDCKYPILIHGPPGTGKTHTLSTMILAISMSYPRQTIHVCAPSNAAVREVALRLLRDSKKTRLLHPSQLCLYGNEDSVDTADDIDLIFYDMRIRRLKDLDIRLAQFKQNMLGFHLQRKDGADNLPSIVETWEWRIEAVTQGCGLMLTIATDLSEEFVSCREQATECLVLLNRWRKHVQRDSMSLVDLHENLIMKACELLPEIRLKRPLRKEDLDAVIHKATKVVFSTVNSAGSKALKASFKTRPLLILDEGE